MVFQLNLDRAGRICFVLSMRIAINYAVSTIPINQDYSTMCIQNLALELYILEEDK